MKQLKIILRVKDFGIGKFGKYRYEIQTRYDQTAFYWISVKQAENLDRNFMYIEKSRPDNIVYGAFEDDRFIWSSDNKEWLCKSFGVDIKTCPDIHNFVWLGKCPVLKIPENVEVADELKDNIITTSENSN